MPSQLVTDFHSTRGGEEKKAKLSLETKARTDGWDLLVQASARFQSNEDAFFSALSVPSPLTLL
jgi:hypothetical protein